MNITTVRDDWESIHPPMSKEGSIMNTVLESYKNKWDKVDNNVVRDKAIAYAEQLRIEYPERKRKHSKAKIPFNRSGDQMLEAEKSRLDRNTQRYLPTSTTFKPNYIWCDAMEIVSFYNRYMGETCAIMRSLIDNKKYYFSVSNLNDIWDKVRGNCVVGTWSFEKHGKIAKLVYWKE